ncbi:MAG TPA: biotin/lipoyl-containing protein [Thermoanaerobaculia bacterium]|nr:biotin/lipoyl-containing protein [Thermoanaerobaculia bacterium]
MKLIGRFGDQNVEIEVDRDGSGYKVTLGGRELHADLVKANEYLRSLLLEDGTQYFIGHHRDGSLHEISFADRTLHVEVLDPLALHRRRREDEEDGEAANVCAMMPGRVVKILVTEGETVRKGAGLLIVEAMKMENEITSPRDAVVRAIRVEPGQAVDNGDELIVLE